MKKLLVFICVVFMTLGVLGCKEHSSRSSSNISTVKPVPKNNPDPSPVPEPATILLLGSGIVGLAGFGRKRFKK